MKNPLQTAKESFASTLGIPREIILGSSFVSMLSNKNIQIENHQGIIKYTPSTVEVKTSQGKIKFKGTDLSIESLITEEILVTGTINSVEFFYE